MIRTEYIIDDDFLDDETKMSAESQGYLWELIRCKDCKHHGYGYFGRCPVRNVTSPNDFCAWAVRRTEND